MLQLQRASTCTCTLIVGNSRIAVLEQLVARKRVSTREAFLSHIFRTFNFDVMFQATGWPDSAWVGRSPHLRYPHSAFTALQRCSPFPISQLISSNPTHSCHSVSFLPPILFITFVSPQNSANPLNANISPKLILSATLSCSALRTSTLVT